jgi:hypothetical protein
VRENPFRPLATSVDLPGGWRVPITAPHMLPAIAETIYPGALADWASHQMGHFQPGSLHTLSQRQMGIFRGIHLIQPAVAEDAVNTICRRCVRHATWFYHQTPSHAIPCVEPCNWWLSWFKGTVAI